MSAPTGSPRLSLALNGAAPVTGLATDGRRGARDALERLWDRVSRNSPLQAFDLGIWVPPLFEPALRRSLEVGLRALGRTSTLTALPEAATA